jgi:2'-5' RNA ligase
VTEPEASRVLGVAIAIPEPYGSALREKRTRFGDADAASVPTHVTLLPPTTVDDVLLPEIHDHLGAIAAKTEPFRMRLGGSGTFRPVSPVVFVTVVQGIGACELLEGNVRSGVLWRPVHFHYHPHVTVAHDLDDGRLDAALDELSSFSATFTVDRFAMYEHRDGAWVRDHEFVFESAT